LSNIESLLATVVIFDCPLESTFFNNTPLLCMVWAEILLAGRNAQWSSAPSKHWWKKPGNPQILQRRGATRLVGRHKGVFWRGTHGLEKSGRN